ncbi:MAG: LamG-like jellyroll fold domain-containing protein [Lentisphaerota bacterium]
MKLLRQGLVALMLLAAGSAHAWPGSALSFNGTNQYISATIPALPYAYTISAWVYLRSGGTDSSYIGVLTGTNCGDSIELMIHSTNSSPTGPQYLELGRCGSFSGERSSQTVPLNQWVHIAVTASHLNTAVTYYVNGTYARTWNPGGANMYLGPNIHLADNVTRHFNGRLDEVQIWSRALSQAEIRTNMYRAPNLPDSNLVAYWPMVTDAGSIITPDASGHGHSGLLTTNRPLPTASVSTWPLSIGALGDNPYTNECHAGFTDPGAFVSNAPADLAAGFDFNLVLKCDRTISAWGGSAHGQTTVPSSATNAIAVAAGNGHALALRADGMIVDWGWSHAAVPATATNVVAISDGGMHSLALRADGSVVAWGDNSYGQVTVPSWATNVVAISAGLSYSLALRSDGTVVAWGDSSEGQTSVPSSATNVIALAAGHYHCLALRRNGTVVAWGQNFSGQTDVPSSATNVIAVAAGQYHSLALRSDGTVVVWGSWGASLIH